MSNVVNVKVCLINENNEELLVRRFDLHLAHLSNYTDFAVKLCEFFPELTGKTFKIFWKDEENDNVVISSSEEIQTAVKQMKSNFKKFYVKMTTTQMKEQNDDTIHPDIVCDGCDCCVIGYRYKCLGCKNYDLCSKCEQAGVHSEHLMLRIPYPFILSRNDLHCISALFPVNCETKHSRHSKRHSHSHSKSHKKRRCDKHDSGPETGEESDEKHHKKHFNRRCAYSQMMNDFFKPFADPAQSDAEKTSEAKSGETKNQKPRVELTLDTVRSIMRSISSLLDPFEINVDFNVQPGAQAEEKQKEQMQKAEKKEQTETSTATPSAPSVAKEVRFATTEKDSESLAQEIEKITEALASQKMNQTAANDDWVSFEELASEEPQTSTSTREASKTSKTEESNSQTETATNKARNLYPTLKSEQQNSDDPVSSALKKMLDMGFTNENDWLSRLLQAKNGDIEQALEVLTAYGK